MRTLHEPAEILLVEDNVGAARLAREAFAEADVRNNLNVVNDGAKALRYLRRQGEYEDARLPHLVLMDWNLPVKHGREVLCELKTDIELRRIPIVVLTTSQAADDIWHAYNLKANCYISKPVDLDQFIHVVKAIEEFWLR